MHVESESDRPMIDDFLVLRARERGEAMRREAEVYRLMIDRAPLVFGPSLATRFRRRIAHLLVRLAGRIAPNGAIAIASDRC